MGIFIHMSISKSVTVDEWKAVYEETLALAEALPFAERRKVVCNGIKTICLVPTVEHEETYGYNHEKSRIGWFAEGDYETMHTAEQYSLFRDFIKEDNVVEEAKDAMWGVFPAYLDSFSHEDVRCSQIFDIWGAKTQGEPYHMYLLAIACLIEARLGEKAFVYGDITRGQCKEAVEIANQYLDVPICVPDRCDYRRFQKRVSKLEISEKEKLEVFQVLYLGTKNAECGQYLRETYSEEVYNEYWKDKFENCFIYTRTFNRAIREYLVQDFNFRTLCRLVDYNDENGIPQYDEFVKRIMDAKLHIKNKNCGDFLQIDQEDTAPYSIYSLFAQIAFMGAENKKIDRYIPLEELRESLVCELGDKCDVNHIIEEYLQKEQREEEIKISKGITSEKLKTFCEQDAAESFNQVMEIKRQDIIENYEKYDITNYEELLDYKADDCIEPDLQEALIKSFAFYTNLLEEDTYKELMKQSANSRCQWLVEQNRCILIRDKDWSRIFTDIENNETSFARYYSMVRVKLTNKDLIDMVKAIILNDELFEYCKKNNR